MIFLAEAFTRPAMMRELAKVGFNQSYTYFTWRNTRGELEEYVTELATETADYFRPNFFVNTPDILHEYLADGRPAGVRGAARARRDALADLRHLLRLRALRERAGASRAARSTSTRRSTSSRSAKIEGPLLPLVQRLNEIRRANRSLQRHRQRHLPRDRATTS